jgi:hypothetical protein
MEPLKDAYARLLTPTLYLMTALVILWSAKVAWPFVANFRLSPDVNAQVLAEESENGLRILREDMGLKLMGLKALVDERGSKEGDAQYEIHKEALEVRKATDDILKATAFLAEDLKKAKDESLLRKFTNSYREECAAVNSAVLEHLRKLAKYVEQPEGKYLALVQYNPENGGFLLPTAMGKNVNRDELRLRLSRLRFALVQAQEEATADVIKKYIRQPQKDLEKYNLLPLN